MSNPLENIIAFVLDKSQDLPTLKRGHLYQDLARICGDQQEAANLNAIADSLISSDALCREFNFSFSQKRNSIPQKGLRK